MLFSVKMKNWRYILEIACSETASNGMLQMFGIKKKINSESYF